MIRVGVIGYGYWGPNLVRNFAEFEESTVVAVSDLDRKQLARVKRRYPALETTTNHRALLSNPGIDAIAIATPVATHFELAMAALRAGKHVFVEKPLTATSDQGERLIDEATKRNLILHVDHTFVYTGAVRKMRELVERGELGDLYYYDSVRVNLGLFQADVSVIWDLAVHDLSILQYVIPLVPTAVSATGVRHVHGSPESIAYCTLFYENNMIAHLHVNWLAPVKLRRTLIGGTRKMVVYDDLEPIEKIKVYDKGVIVGGDREALYQSMMGYRTGDMWAPQLDTTEALLVEVQHFTHCITSGKQPITDGEAGVAVVRTLEAAAESLRGRGRPIALRG